MNDITSLKKQYDELIAQANEIKKKINELNTKTTIIFSTIDSINFKKALDLFGKSTLDNSDISGWIGNNGTYNINFNIFQNNISTNFQGPILRNISFSGRWGTSSNLNENFIFTTSKQTNTAVEVPQAYVSYTDVYFIPSLRPLINYKE